MSESTEKLKYYRYQCLGCKKHFFSYMLCSVAFTHHVEDCPFSQEDPFRGDLTDTDWYAPSE